MTLNDLELRNSPYFAFFSPNSIALQADYVTVVEDGPIMSAPLYLRTLWRYTNAVIIIIIFKILSSSFSLPL